MIPRPKSQNQTRLAALRANQGFLGANSQLAKASRGSWPGDNSAGVPSGNAAVPSVLAAASVAACSRSNRTISSFHSPVGLKAICEKNAAVPDHRSLDQLSGRTPMKLRATACAMACGSLL